MEDRFKRFTVSITKIRRSIQRIKAEEMAEYNLKSPHLSCLYYLYTEGTLTAKELCDICDEDKAAISRSILQLEKEEYVVYRSEAKKRYRTPIELTEKGKRIAKSLVEKVENVLAKVGADLTEKERIAFYANLELISINLEKLCDSYDE